MSDLCDRCTYEGQERCQDGRGYPACMESAATHWKETALTLDKTRTDPSASVPDLDRSFVTVMVPTAPRTTASSSPPDPTHVPMVVSLSELAAWLSKEDDRG